MSSEASSPGYLRAAFLVPANLLALAGAAVASAFVGDPSALLVALGAESLYLGVLSSAPNFRRAVRATFHSRKNLAAGNREVSTLLAELSASQRQHYEHLRQLRDRILAHYARLPGGRVMVASSEPRIDALLTAFLRLLTTLSSYRQYLNAADRPAIEAELSRLGAQADLELNPRLKEVMAKRVDILKLRVQRFVEAEESRAVVSHQLAGIEDLLRLTHEQSITLRDPETVSQQLDALTVEVQSTEETVREMERFMAFTEETRPQASHASRVR